MTEIAWFSFLVAVLVFLYHLWRQRDWDRERRDLLNRLMARTPSEYSALQQTQERPKPPPEPPKEEIVLEEPPDLAKQAALEEITRRAIAGRQVWLRPGEGTADDAGGGGGTV